jgi:hypothetical protein
LFSTLDLQADIYFQLDDFDTAHNLLKRIMEDTADQAENPAALRLRSQVAHNLEVIKPLLAESNATRASGRLTAAE